MPAIARKNGAARTAKRRPATKPVAVAMLDVDAIDPSPENRRADIDLAPLGESVRTYGIQTPIKVRPKGDRFEIVFGERRWRAAKELELASIPATVEDLTDEEAQARRVLENTQRRDPHALEEAEAYERLLAMHDRKGKPVHTAESIAQIAGRSAAHVYNRLKLTALAPELRKAFYAGELTVTGAFLIARGIPTAMQAEAWARMKRYAEEEAFDDELDDNGHLGTGVIEAVKVELHVGEAGATVVAGKTLVIARLVDHRIELRLHAGHGVNLACQCGDVERVHHRRRRDLEQHGAIDRSGQHVDRGNALLRVDEQPLPVQCHRIDLQRLHVGRQRLGGRDAIQRAEGIQGVGGDPGNGAEGDDDLQGRGPDHELELGRVIPVGGVGRLGVGGAVTPREQQGQHDHRNDDQQHQQGGADDQLALLGGDVAGRMKDDRVATGQKQQNAGDEQGAEREFGEGHWTGHFTGEKPRLLRRRAIYCLTRPESIGLFVPYQQLVGGMNLTSMPLSGFATLLPHNNPYKS